MNAIKARLSRFQTVEEYMLGYGHYYFRGGILLPTRQTREEGSRVSFHLQIATGETVLRGEGVVQQVRTNAEGNTVGMVIRFNKLDARSKGLVDRILAEKREARTSANLAITKKADAESATEAGAPDEAGEEHLGADEIGAIADAIDSTFDSIFTGSFVAAEVAAAPATGGVGDLAAGAEVLAEPSEPEAVATAGSVAADSEDEHAERDADLDRIASEAVERAMAAGDDDDGSPIPGSPSAVVFGDLRDPVGPQTVLGIPGIGSSATVEAVQEALGRVPLRQTTQAELEQTRAEAEAEAEAEAPLPANRDRVRDFIKNVTGKHEVVTGPRPPTGDSVIPGPVTPSAAHAAVGVGGESAERGQRVPTDEIMAAAEHSKVAALEAEAALDQLLQSGSTIAAPEPLGEPEEFQAPVPKKKGNILSRFFGWLGRLFGGKKG